MNNAFAFMACVWCGVTIASATACKSETPPPSKADNDTGATARSPVDPLPAPAPSPTQTAEQVAPRGAPTEVMKFVVWAVEHRGQAVKATSEPDCKPDGWCGGFCKGFQSTTAAFCGVRYWKADRKAVRFDIGMVPGPLSCADLADGASQRGRTSQDIGCVLPGGMVGLINLRGGEMNSVFVATPEYLQRDTAMSIP